MTCRCLGDGRKPSFSVPSRCLDGDDRFLDCGHNNELEGCARGRDSGRWHPALELDTNPVENQIRPIALTRKNALFAGHEVGAENWAMLASLVATSKMSEVKPVDYIADTLRVILDRHPMNAIEDLMPRNFRKTSTRAA